MYGYYNPYQNYRPSYRQPQVSNYFGNPFQQQYDDDSDYYYDQRKINQQQRAAVELNARRRQEAAYRQRMAREQAREEALAREREAARERELAMARELGRREAQQERMRAYYNQRDQETEEEDAYGFVPGFGYVKLPRKPQPSNVRANSRRNNNRADVDQLADMFQGFSQQQQTEEPESEMEGPKVELMNEGAPEILVSPKVGEDEKREAQGSKQQNRQQGRQQSKPHPKVQRVPPQSQRRPQQQQQSRQKTNQEHVHPMEAFLRQFQGQGFNRQHVPLPEQKASVAPEDDDDVKSVGSTATVATNLDLSDPMVEQAATTLQRRYRANLHRRQQLSAITCLASAFQEHMDSFRWPEKLDFEVRKDGTTKLSYTPNNNPVYAYEEYLLALLGQLDGISSNGDREIKNPRKALVLKITQQLQEIDDTREREGKKYLETLESSGSTSTELTAEALAKVPSDTAAEAVARSNSLEVPVSNKANN